MAYKEIYKTVRPVDEQNSVRYFAIRRTVISAYSGILSIAYFDGSVIVATTEQSQKIVLGAGDVAFVLGGVDSTAWISVIEVWNDDDPNYIYGADGANLRSVPTGLLTTYPMVEEVSTLFVSDGAIDPITPPDLSADDFPVLWAGSNSGAKIGRELFGSTAWNQKQAGAYGPVVGAIRFNEPVLGQLFFLFSSSVYSKVVVGEVIGGSRSYDIYYLGEGLGFNYLWEANVNNNLYYTIGDVSSPNPPPPLTSLSQLNVAPLIPSTGTHYADMVIGNSIKVFVGWLDSGEALILSDAAIDDDGFNDNGRINANHLFGTGSKAKLHAIAWGTTHGFVTIGDDGTAARSQDGVAWYSSDISAVLEGASIRTIVYVRRGLTYEDPSNADPFFFFSQVDDEGFYLAGGTKGTLLLSHDGLNWARVEPEGGLSAQDKLGTFQCSTHYRREYQEAADINNVRQTLECVAIGNSSGSVYWWKSKGYSFRFNIQPTPVSP